MRSDYVVSERKQNRNIEREGLPDSCFLETGLYFRFITVNSLFNVWCSVA